VEGGKLARSVEALAWAANRADASGYALLAVDFAYLVIWLFVVRPEFVAQAGREYAAALFRTLE
jgi:hypothetical protein